MQADTCPAVTYAPRAPIDRVQRRDAIRSPILAPRQVTPQRTRERHVEGDLAELMRYAATASKWPEDQRRYELRRLSERDYGKAGTDLKLREAVLLMLSHGNAVHQQRARKLLESVVHQAPPSAQAALATFLLGVQDPERVAERDTLDKLKSQLENERSERQALQRKLDELKNIEKSMNDRKPSESLPLEDVGKAKNSSSR